MKAKRHLYVCKCGRILKYPSEFCLSCGNINAVCSALYMKDKTIKLYFFSDHKGYITEEYKFKIYDDEVSIRNIFEVIAEQIHWRRLNGVLISANSFEKLKFCSSLIEKYALTNLKVKDCSVFDNSISFVNSILKMLSIKRKLKKVEIKPEDKIRGAHSTIIGGREGKKFLHVIACCEYIKKIVPGVIEGRGASSGGGVRIKLTRSDDKGNIRGMLIDGTSVQKILVITTASNEDEGEFIRKILLESLSEYFR